MYAKVYQVLDVHAYDGEPLVIEDTHNVDDLGVVAHVGSADAKPAPVRLGTDLKLLEACIIAYAQRYSIISVPSQGEFSELVDAFQILGTPRHNILVPLYDEKTVDHSHKWLVQPLEIVDSHLVTHDVGMMRVFRVEDPKYVDAFDLFGVDSASPNSNNTG